MIYYDLYKYKKWTFLILASQKGLKEINLYNNEDLSKYTTNKEIMSPYIKLLDNYFNKKELPNFNLDINGTNFQMMVWEELMKIGFGETTNYETLAKKINNPKSSRAVGNAVGMNPILIFIPCHRVIRKDGKLGGFSSDPQLKVELLNFENSFKF